MKKEISSYDQQAIDFLTKYNLKLEAVEAVPQTAPRWATNGEHGVQWSITIAKMKGEPRPDKDIVPLKELSAHVEKSIQFFFWSSIKEKEDYENSYPRKFRHPRPSAYSVLANVYDPSVTTFEDFCSSFGFDTDSKKADETFKEVVALNKKIESILPLQALDDILEIQ